MTVGVRAWPEHLSSHDAFTEMEDSRENRAIEAEARVYSRMCLFEMLLGGPRGC